MLNTSIYLGHQYSPARQEFHYEALLGFKGRKEDKGVSGKDWRLEYKFDSYYIIYLNYLLSILYLQERCQAE